MKYRIGEIANLLGVSTEAIRFFEKQGLVTPVRDRENGYRMYEVGDHNILMRARGYSRFGFTVAESAKLISDCDLEDLSEKFKERAVELEQSIQMEQLLLDCLKERQRHIERITVMLGQCVIERSPAMYGLLYRKNQFIGEDSGLRSQVRSWSDKKPIAEALMVYPLEQLLRREPGYLMGLGMEESFARRLHMDAQPNALYFPSRKSVYSVVRVPHIFALKPALKNPFTRTLQFIRDNHLTLAGDSYGRTLHTSKKNGEYVHYCEQWFPIE